MPDTNQTPGPSNQPVPSQPATPPVPPAQTPASPVNPPSQSLDITRGEPAPTSGPPTAQAAVPAAGGQTKGTVLVADDDITLRDMYQTRLETDGFQVIVAADGEEALSVVKSKKPDVVLLDIMMPKLNGLDVLAQMKKEEELKKIPVIILTALIQDLTKVKSLMSGADDYLMKSEVMPGEVIKKVESVLGKAKG